MSGDLLGQQLAHFRIQEKLGQGGMGVVYKARDETLRRTIALKVLTEDFAADDERRRRFLREARSGAAVTHANIAAVYEIGEVDGRVYIAMEYIDGRTLREVLEEGPLSIRESVRIARDIARGLARAHDKGIVHRDLKPDNVMVTADGDVKVLDFGVATWVRQADGMAGSVPPPPMPGSDVATASDPSRETVDAPGMTDAGRLVGTPAYMAPEQAMGRPLDQRADVFSFGVVLYEMVVGRRPFDTTGTNVAVLIATTSETPAPPSQGNAGVTPALERLIERCLAKLPSQRYANAREIVRDLESLDLPQPLSSAPPSLPAFEVDGNHAVSNPTLTSSPDSLRAPRTSSARPGTPSRPTPRSGGPGPFSTLDPASPPTLADGPGAKRAQPRRRGVLVPALALAVAGGLAAVEVARYASHRDDAPRSGEPAPAVSATRPQPTALIDLPPPRTPVPAALVAYQTAMRAFHDGNFEAFDAGMRDSVRLDPDFAAGELRVAFAMWHSVRGGVTDARNHLQRASRLRVGLSERDQDLLDALEPVINREPPDGDETERRLESAVHKHPLDAEFLYLLANEQRRYDVSRALATYDRVMAVDPGFMTALRQKAQTLEMVGDVATARALLDDCLRKVPGATGCRNERIWLNQDEGSCEAIEHDARQMIASDPESYRAYEALARAAVALGRPREAVNEILKETWARAPEEVRAREQVLTEARLAALQGRFGEARDLGKRFEIAIDRDASAATHARAALFLAEIAVETGDVKGGGAIAEDFLKRQIAWAGAPDGDTGRMLRIERLAGVIDDAQYAAARGVFLEGWLAQSSRVRFPRGVGWVVAYGAEVEGEADAREALATQAAFAPIPVGQRTALNDDAVGRARFFAGDVDGATAPLGRASRMCTAFDEPFRHVRSTALLGRALETKGDTKDACAAYGAVVQRWGGAAPASVTAALAKKRRAALKCGP